MSRVLVGSQVALTTVLVIVAALLGRSWQSLNQVDLGYRTDIARFAVTSSARDLGTDAAQFMTRLRDAVRAERRVVAVGLAWPTLPPWDAYRPTFAHAALGEIPPERAPRLGAHAIDEHLFATLGMTMRAGRGIETRDHANSEPVAVISEALAAHLGGSDRVLGTLLAITDPDRDVPERARIVGVASDVAWDGVGEQGTGRMIRWGDAEDLRAPRFDAYYSLAQIPGAARQISIAARVSGNPAAAIEPISRAIGKAVPLSAVHWASAMRDELAVEYRSSSFALLLTLTFGGGALLLAGIGLFATLMHTVGRRIPEFGVRLALGASPGRLRAQVLRSGLRLVAVGLVAGGVAAVAVTRVLSRLLYEVGPGDPLAFIGSAGVLMAVGVVACWLPARRASRVDAVEALRAE